MRLFIIFIALCFSLGSGLSVRADQMVLMSPHADEIQNEFEAAFQAYFQALDVDATREAPYAFIIDLLIQTHDFTRAFNLCDAALRFAHEHQEEVWAEPLHSALEEQRARVTESSNKFQNR